MIPQEVAEIAALIDVNWDHREAPVRAEILAAAWRIHRAGYRLPVTE